MCGIVLMGCKYPGARDVDLFEQLLFADTFRGPHSTGVHSLFQLEDKGPVITETQKKQLDGPAFIASNLWPLVSERRVPGATANSVLIKRPFCMIGHNRWATKGGINDANAHPFTHGHITMVHNGTLRNQALLPDHAKFEVDSDNVAYALSVWGVEKTVQNLNGAFTLIWHDANLQTVNIIRNSERPFHLARTSAGDWFGASEESMLKWILSRQKVPVTVAESFECEVGVQYIFDVSTGKFLPKENVKHELPTFRTTFYQGFSQGASSYYDDEYDYDTWWNERGTRHSTNTETRQTQQARSSTSVSTTDAAKRREMNELLWEHGITQRIGDRVNFTSTDFQGYPKNSPYGEMVGYLDTREYVGTISHGVEKKLYNQFQEYRGEIVKAVVEDGTLYVTISKPMLLESIIEPREDGEPNGNIALIEYPNVGTRFEYKITLINMTTRTWSGQTAAGIDVYGDWFHRYSGMEVGDVWSGRSVVRVDNRYRMADCTKVSGKEGLEGEIKEGDKVKFRITSLNLGTTSFEGMTVKGNQKVSGSIPTNLCMALGEEFEGVVYIAFNDKSFRVNNVCRPGTVSNQELLASIADLVVDDEKVNTTATGERFTAKKWEESLVSTCCACSSPISFDDMKDAVIISGYSFCKECKDLDPPFDGVVINHPVAVAENWFDCPECDMRKHMVVKSKNSNLCITCEGKKSRVTRPILSVSVTSNRARLDSDMGKEVEFVITQLATGPAFWGKTRTDIAVSGVIPEDVVAHVGEIWKGVISHKFVDGSYRIENIKKRSTSEVVRSISDNRDIKTLPNGASIKKDLWDKMCNCKHCSNPIPWDDADLVTFVGGVPVCKTCEKVLI